MSRPLPRMIVGVTRRRRRKEHNNKLANQSLWNTQGGSGETFSTEPISPSYEEAEEIKNLAESTVVHQWSPPSSSPGRISPEPVRQIVHTSVYDSGFNKSMEQDGDSKCRFACPFYKNDPSVYREHSGQDGNWYRVCAGPGWSTIPLLIEHLARKHLPIQCQKCFRICNIKGEVTSEGLQQLGPHILNDTCCNKSSKLLLECMSYDQWAHIVLKEKRRARNIASESGDLQADVDEWGQIWKILFPDLKIPATPWCDIEQIARSHPSFAQDRFVEIHAECLEKVLPDIMATNSDLELRETLSYLAQKTFEIWSKASKQAGISEDWRARDEPSGQEKADISTSQSAISPSQLPLPSTVSDPLTLSLKMDVKKINAEVRHVLVKTIQNEDIFRSPYAAFEHASCKSEAAHQLLSVFKQEAMDEPVSFQFRSAQEWNTEGDESMGISIGIHTNTNKEGKLPATAHENTMVDVGKIKAPEEHDDDSREINEAESSTNHSPRFTVGSGHPNTLQDTIHSENSDTESGETSAKHNRITGMGKSSPYLSRTYAGDNSTESDAETDWSKSDELDGMASSSSSSTFDFDTLVQRELFRDIMGAFWEIYNKEIDNIISRLFIILGDYSESKKCAVSGQCQPSSSVSSTSEGKSDFRSSTKRILTKDEVPRDDDPDRKRQKTCPLPGSTDKTEGRLACPFRKHNPGKYNMYHYSTCALSPFETVARVKEHLYRRHRAQIQCVRCWLFFEDQSDLDVHLKVVNICIMRDGEPAEGITPGIEKRLKSRKRQPGEQSEEARWKDVYKILFPEEDIPSPYFERVQDDAAESLESRLCVFQEFLRRELPHIVTNRARAAIHCLNGDEHISTDSLRDKYIKEMSKLVSEGLSVAIESYQKLTSAHMLHSKGAHKSADAASSQNTDLLSRGTAPHVLGVSHEYGISGPPLANPSKTVYFETQYSTFDSMTDSFGAFENDFTSQADTMVGSVSEQQCSLEPPLFFPPSVEWNTFQQELSVSNVKEVPPDVLQREDVAQDYNNTQPAWAPDDFDFDSWSENLLPDISTPRFNIEKLERS